MRNDHKERVRELPDRLARILDRTVTLSHIPGGVVCITTVSLVLWLLLLGRSVPFPNPVDGRALIEPGVPAATANAHGVAGAGAYLLLFGVVLSAVTYPAIADAVATQTEESPDSHRLLFGAVVLVTYSLAWMCVGVLPLLVDAVVDFPRLIESHTALLTGGTLVLAGLYQFTRFKFDAVETTAAEQTDAEWRSLAAIECGFELFGAVFVAGWAVVAVLIVVGLLNPFWLLLAAAVFALERASAEPARVVSVIGALALIGGSIVLVFGTGWVA